MSTARSVKLPAATTPPEPTVSPAVAAAVLRGGLTWPLFRQIAAKILLGGRDGIAVGICAAAFVGAFFFGIGAVVGVFVGIPLGFLAGLIGATIGGRGGWALGGAASLVFPISLIFAYQNSLDPISFAVAVVALAYSAGVGIWYGGRRRAPTVQLGPSGSQAGEPITVSFYTLPLSWRLLGFAAVFGTAFGIVMDATRLLGY